MVKNKQCEFPLGVWTKKSKLKKDSIPRQSLWFVMHTAYSLSLSQYLPVKQLWPNGEIRGIHKSIWSITKTFCWKELQTAIRNLISYAFIQFTWQKSTKCYTEFILPVYFPSKTGPLHILLRQLIIFMIHNKVQMSYLCYLWTTVNKDA